MPSARVVGAFHHVSAVSLWKHDGPLGHEDVLVCGDDAEARGRLSYVFTVLGALRDLTRDDLAAAEVELREDFGAVGVHRRHERDPESHRSVHAGAESVEVERLVVADRPQGRIHVADGSKRRLTMFGHEVLDTPRVGRLVDGDVMPA